MKEAAVDPAVRPLRESILRTVLYYDIFNYPLKADEVYRFLNTHHTSAAEVTLTLRNLSAEGYLYQFGEFFCAQNNAALVARRVKGNEAADTYTRIAQRQAKLIARFPFVRAVLASGSLSKGYMDETSDLDFFIITQPGRLWIARMLLVLYKRLFLFNSHKLFCVNYFIDSDHLEIEEKNLFTATELATVLPLEGTHLYQSLLKKNDWLLQFFPNFRPRTSDNAPLAHHGVKNFVEKLIHMLGGDFWEQYCMRLTDKRWKKMYARDYEQADFKVAFKTKKYASKNHPRHYQKKVIDLYQEKLDAYRKKFNLVV